MAPKEQALSLLRAWAAGQESPKADQLNSSNYVITLEQAQALWNLASKPTGNLLNTDSPLPR
ncbi:hypothetical protein SSTU70S_05691 [Stutzerimonas stutzeri]